MPFTSSKVDGTLTSAKLDSAFIDAGEDRAGDRVTSIVLPSVTNTSSIGSITLSAPAVGTITLPSISSTSSANPVTLVDAGAGTFVVTDAPYSAAGDGVTDDTAAIQAAIDAASAYASASTPATVYFPPGTYKIIPPGRAYATIYKKTSGAWGSALASNISTDQVVDTNFHYMSAAPTGGDGADGDIWFDSVKGLVYRKAAGTWSSAAKMMDGSGTGWICQYSATSTYPTYQVVPSNSDGADGDYAIMYHVRYSNHGLSCFEINPEHSYITFKGAGETSKLLKKCFADEDPDDYTVDATMQTITATRIPGSQMGTYNQGSYAPYRGAAFVMSAGASETITNVKWDSLWIDGGTLANGKHGYYDSFDIIEEWDTSNKGIVFTWDIGTVTGAEVTNCKFTGFRGETLYKGGSNTADVTIADTTISECNGSAVSISGTTNMSRCTITNSYNGVENFCLGTQTVTITDCNIDLDAGSWRGDFGVVYLGQANAAMTVSGGDIGGTGKSAIYLADAAQNVVIQNCTLRDAQWGVYAYYINQYGTGLPINFDNVTIENVVFKASTRNMSYGVYMLNGGVVPADPWLITGCSIVEENGFTFGFPIRLFPNTLDATKVTVSSCNFTGANGAIYLADRVVPIWGSGNTLPRNIVNSYSTDPQASFWAGSPVVRISRIGVDNQEWSIAFNPLRVPNGYEVDILYSPDQNRTFNCVIPAATWNTLISDIVLSDGDPSVVFRYDAATEKFSLVT